MVQLFEVVSYEEYTFHNSSHIVQFHLTSLANRNDLLLKQWSYLPLDVQFHHAVTVRPLTDTLLVKQAEDTLPAVVAVLPGNINPLLTVSLDHSLCSRCISGTLSLDSDDNCPFDTACLTRAIAESSS